MKHRGSIIWGSVMSNLDFRVAVLLFIHGRAHKDVMIVSDICNGGGFPYSL